MTRRTKTEQLDPVLRGNRCIANRKNGQKCKSWAIKGGSVCRMHGGGLPQVKRKAQERIDAAADTAASKLIEFMNSDQVPFPVRIQAARDLLDRAGLGKGTEITVKLAKFEENFAGLFVDIDDGIIDAEVVEDEPSRGDRALLTRYGANG